MKRMTVALLAGVLLAGCDDAPAPKQMVPTESVANAGANVIYLPDNTGMDFSGGKVTERETKNERGTYRRVTVSFKDFNIGEVEKSVSSVLHRSGYKRKVRESDKNSMRVTYIKQGVAPVTARYQRVAAKGQQAERVTLRLSWKID